MKKLFSRMTTDKDIEALLEEDLSDYLHKDNFKLVTFLFNTKNKKQSLKQEPDDR